jgi:hypothetical protein
MSVPVLDQVSPWRSTRRWVVYTTLFGYSELFNDFVYERDDHIDFICFTDNSDLSSQFWHMKVLKPEFLDPARAAKQVKLMPHRFLPGYECSLYIDNTVRLKVSARQIFEQFLLPAEPSFICFKHPFRNCVYAEAEAVLAAGYDDAVRVHAQMQLYRRFGYPENNGLAAGTFILRRHHAPGINDLMEKWFQQVLCYSKRDQLSFNPTIWLYHFAIGYLELQLDRNYLIEWPVVKNGIRVPRDFDDAQYLALNPDVRIDPRKHYLLYGAIEKRQYKIG